MSLIVIHSKYPETETRFIGVSFDSRSSESQYIQSYKGKDVARFKVKESFFKIVYAYNLR